MTDHKKGDTVPADWYEVTFKNNETLKDYPNFSMVFLVDCTSDMVDGKRELHYISWNDKDTLLIDNICNANIAFNPFLAIRLSPLRKLYKDIKGLISFADSKDISK